MMKKDFKHALAVVLITVFVVLALGSATGGEPAQQAGPIQVENSIIGYAIAVQVIEQRGWTVGSFDNSGIRVLRVEMGTIFQPVRSDVVFTVLPAGTLDVRFANSQGRMSDSWVAIDSLAEVNRNTARRSLASFRTEVLQELQVVNLDISDAVMNNFLGNFQYLSAFMGTLTQVGRTSVVELITGRTYRWSWPLISIAENNNPAFDRRFVARFQIQNRNLGGTVTLNVFTNDTTLLAIPLNQNVQFSGVLVSVEGNNVFNLLHE